MIINPLHGYYREAHLEHVIAEMKRRGAPVLRGYYDADANVWHMREGTHRLRAALRLGIAPVLIPVPWHKTRGALVRARMAAAINGHMFDRVVTLSPFAEQGFSPLGQRLEA